MWCASSSYASTARFASQRRRANMREFLTAYAWPPANGRALPPTPTTPTSTTGLAVHCWPPAEHRDDHVSGVRSAPTHRDADMSPRNWPRIRETAVEWAPRPQNRERRQQRAAPPGSRRPHRRAADSIRRSHGLYQPIDCGGSRGCGDPTVCGDLLVFGDVMACGEGMRCGERMCCGNPMNFMDGGAPMGDPTSCAIP